MQPDNPVRKLLSAQTRTNRLTFLVYVVITLALSLTADVFHAMGGMVGLLLAIFFALLALAVYLSSWVGRLHDLNQPGWLAVAALIPMVNLAGLALLLVIPGNKDVNKYGAPVEGVKLK